MHIYAFGSICRGDVTPGSDVDLLAITDGYDPRFDANTYSIYSYARLRQLWNEGNPFAWHLSLESRLLFSDDDTDFLRSLSQPCVYAAVEADCEKFFLLFKSAKASIETGTNSPTFELSTIFLAVRNFATCFSLGIEGRPDFSRRSALHLGSRSLQIGVNAFSVLERARIMSTRGNGEHVAVEDVAIAMSSFDAIQNWMTELSLLAKEYARI